jgi:hypothetical protein
MLLPLWGNPEDFGSGVAKGWQQVYRGLILIDEAPTFVTSIKSLQAKGV